MPHAISNETDFFIRELASQALYSIAVFHFSNKQEDAISTAAASWYINFYREMLKLPPKLSEKLLLFREKTGTFLWKPGK